MRKFLIMFSNLFSPGYWSEKISAKFGMYKWAKQSPIRKWALSLTGWKWWAYQIVCGILFVIIAEFILNKIGMTMLPWK